MSRTEEARLRLEIYYEEGNLQGIVELFEDVAEAAWRHGYDEGYDDGYNVGYDIGYDTGYSHGAGE